MNPGSFERGRRLESMVASIRMPVLILGVIILFAAVAIVVLAPKHGKPDSKGQPANSAAQKGEARRVIAQESVGENRTTPGQVSLGASTAFEAQRTDKARQLVKALSEINIQPGELTPEKAAEWHRKIEELIEQGTAAVPPLQEFFQKNADLKFDSGSGTNLLGESSLRTAFIKVLFDIPTPENVELQDQVLRTTTDPDEIVLLARQLELQEPGKHRETILNAAGAALERARNGELPGRATSPLLKILEDSHADDVK